MHPAVLGTAVRKNVPPHIVCSPLLPFSTRRLSVFPVGHSARMRSGEVVPTTDSRIFNFSRKVAVDYFFRQCQMRRNQRIDAVRAKKQQVPSNHTQLTGLSFVERRDLEASASRAMHPDAQQHGVRPDIQPCSAPASPIGPNPNSSSRCQGQVLLAGVVR